MEFADFSEAGGDLLGGSGLRRSNLFPQQFLIDQAIEGCFALGRGERIGIAANGQGLEGDFLLPIALQNHVAVHVGDHTIHDLTAEGWDRQRHAQRQQKRAMLCEFDAWRRSPGSGDGCPAWTCAWGGSSATTTPGSRCSTSEPAGAPMASAPPAAIAIRGLSPHSR